MPKRRKKRKPARPPLTKLDEWLYFTGAAIFIVALIASLFVINLLEDVYYFSDQSILAVKKHASELLFLPAVCYLMLSVIPIFLVPYGNDQPLFGDPKIRYGSPPWAPDCYPIFGRQRHLARLTPKAHQFRKRMLHFWFAGLLIVLALALLSFFGRDCLLRDYSIVSYDMLNRESNRTFPSEFSSLELEAEVRYYKSWTTSVKAKLNAAEGDSFSFESRDFANKDRALALRSMQTLKGMVPPQNVSLQGRDKLRDLVRRGNYTKEETALLYNLFDTEMPVEQNEETGISIIEKNGLYSIRIVDPKGVPLAEYGPYGKEPTIEEVGKLQAVSLQTGTGDATRWTFYYDPRTGQLSEPFMGVLNTDGKLVVYIAPDGKAVCVKEIFGQYYERFEAFLEDLASTAEPFIGAELSKNDNSFSLTYLSGPDYHRKTDRFTLSRDIFGNSLSVTEKESWFNDFEVQGEQVRLRCHLVLCNDGEKPQTVHLVGVFREDAGKLLRYARLNAAHPEDEDSFDFVLMPGKNVCDVVFVGEHGLENVKQNRLLPEIEIIRVG